jgi:protein phosphatase 2C family protein 2/3
VHHRVDDSPDDIDMDIDSRFRPNSGPGSRLILLGDGTEISTEAPDSEMFDHADEDKDLDSQVNKFQSEESNGRNTREKTPAQAAQATTTESPSSVKTEKSESIESAPKDTRVPEKIPTPSEK